MGFLEYGDERLIIESRFCGEGEDYFFQYLLDRVLDFPNIIDLETDANQDNSLMELVRHTIEFIKGKPYGNNLLLRVKDEVKLVINVTPGYDACDRQKVIERNQKNTVRHAYFWE